MQQIKVYILTDTDAIEHIVNDDLDRLRSALADGLAPDVETVDFATEREALAFCAGLGYRRDERSLPDVYPLRSFESCDQVYIKLLTETSVD